MSHDPNDVVKVYAGPLETVESYREVLMDAGIESRIVGTALTSVFGNAIPDTVELWVHQGDIEKAKTAIETYERQSKEEAHPRHSHPTDAPKPRAASKHKEPYVNPDPSGE
ncbi:MAG TPA: hypothetical protein VG097_14390 [Gemmata sp.]|nr:hypothetical protein [Gemmata sp.]